MVSSSRYQSVSGSCTTRDLSTSRDSTSNTAQPASLGIAADSFGGVEREGPGEGAQATEHGPLVGSEQLVAPLDRGKQGLLAGQHRTSPTRQEQEAPVELLGDPVRGHGPAASGSQLQGERDAVQTAADLTHRAGIQIGERETRAGPPGSVCEQAHRVEHRELDDVHPVARGGGR